MQSYNQYLADVNAGYVQLQMFIHAPYNYIMYIKDLLCMYQTIHPGSMIRQRLFSTGHTQFVMKYL